MLMKETNIRDLRQFAFKNRHGVACTWNFHLKKCNSQPVDSKLALFVSSTKSRLVLQKLHIENAVFVMFCQNLIFTKDSKGLFKGV